MDFTKLKAPTLKELFVRELEAMILSGKLKIGEKLPPERVLAEKMQVSRAVINGGIAELARKGFLEVKPRSGVYVLDYRRYGTVDTLLSIMNYNGGHLRRDEIQSILEIKMIVDKLAVELSVDRHTAEDIISLEGYLQEILNDNIEEAAKLIGKYDIVKEEVALEAIPNCNIVYIDSDEMKDQLESYLTTLYVEDPNSIGGAMPDDEFP